MLSPPGPPAPPKPGARATLAFAASGAVIGTASTGVNFFVLLYYDQAVHLRAALAGLALGLALIVDGVMDPAVGWLSDRWRSRLGRRHPFLYASILPMALGYWALWFPPFGPERQGALFAYLLGVTILLRVSITLFDIPTNALIAEVTTDYDRRTGYAAAKTAMNWGMANVIGIAMYAVWLRDAPGAGAGSGVQSRSGYQDAAVWIAGALLAATASVPLLLRPWIPWLRRLPPASWGSPAAALRGLVQTYANPSILALLLSATLFAVGLGLTQALWVYFLSFFWGLDADGVNAVQGAYLAASLFTWWALPRIGRGRDKRRLVIWLSAAFWLDDAAPIALRLAGLMPADGSPSLLPALIGFGFVDGVLFNAVIAMTLSMLADVVEDNQRRTGRREEGVVLAGQTLVTKASTALGTMAAAALLTAIAFPHGEAAAAITPDMERRLGLSFVASMWLLGIASTLCLTRYRIGRPEAAGAPLPAEPSSPEPMEAASDRDFR